MNGQKLTGNKGFDIKIKVNERGSLTSYRRTARNFRQNHLESPCEV